MNKMKVLLIVLSIFSLSVTSHINAAVKTTTTRVTFFTSQASVIDFCLTHGCKSTLIDSSYSKYFLLYIVHYSHSYSKNLGAELLSLSPMTSTQVVKLCYSEDTLCVKVAGTELGYSVSYWKLPPRTPTNPQPKEPEKPGEEL